MIPYNFSKFPEKIKPEKIFNPRRQNELILHHFNLEMKCGRLHIIPVAYANN